MAEGSGTRRTVVAAAVLLVAVVILLRQVTCRSEPEAVLGEWVCDECETKMKRPFDSVSPDCPACAQGQIVQPVFFKCKKCGAVFEGYQFDWSPNAPRAAAKRAHADADPARQNPDEGPKVLIRRPGGPCAWTGSKAGLSVMRRLKCPSCGEGPASRFQKQAGGIEDAGTR